MHLKVDARTATRLTIGDAQTAPQTSCAGLSGPARMIIRILTARVPARNAPAFESLLRQQLPRMREHDGLLYLKLARQAHDGFEDVMLFEEWRDTDALHGWAGNALNKARLLPGAEGLVENVDVTHYEALDFDPDELTAGPPPDEPEGG